MNKKILILLALILLISSVFYFFNNQKQPEDNFDLELDFEQSASYYHDYYYDKFNDEYKKELNLDLKNNIIENWDLYEEILLEDEKWIGVGDCGSSEFNNFRLKASQGDMSILKLKGAVDLIITPNYSLWSNEEFLNFNQRDDIICAVGGRYPLHVYEDKLLWNGVCDERELNCVGAKYLIEKYKIEKENKNNTRAWFDFENDDNLYSTTNCNLLNKKTEKDWSAYQESKHCFSLQYPSDWLIIPFESFKETYTRITSLQEDEIVIHVAGFEDKKQVIENKNILDNPEITHPWGSDSIRIRGDVKKELGLYSQYLDNVYFFRNNYFISLKYKETEFLENQRDVFEKMVNSFEVDRDFKIQEIK